MSSQTLKFVTIMFCGLVGITWMILSIKNSYMVDPPQWCKEMVIGLLVGKYADTYVANRKRPKNVEAP